MCKNFNFLILHNIKIIIEIYSNGLLRNEKFKYFFNDSLKNVEVRSCTEKNWTSGGDEHLKEFDYKWVSKTIYSILYKLVLYFLKHFCLILWNIRAFIESIFIHLLVDPISECRNVHINSWCFCLATDSPCNYTGLIILIDPFL